MTDVRAFGTRSLDDRYLVADGTIYLTGLQALVRMLLDRQRHDESRGHHGSIYVTGYEGSPLAGYDLEIQRRRSILADRRIVHAPAVNEELAATAVYGTQLADQVATLTTDGVTGVWYGKAPGLDRATDAFRHAMFIGTSPKGGAVALVGDDPTAKSSTVPSSSEPALADLQLPTLCPADAHEVLRHGLHAVELSRAAGVWTAMKVAANVADGAATATVSSQWTPPVLDDPRAYAHVPHAQLIGAGLAGLERSLQEVRLPIAAEYLRRSGLNRILGARRSARIGLVAAGKTYLDLRQALDSLGLTDSELERTGLAVLKLGAVVPVEPTVVREFARGLTEIIVVEDKRSYLESAVKEILYGTPDAPAVVGRRDPHGARLFPAVGELSPTVVAAGLAARLREHDGFHGLRPPRQRPRQRLSLPLVTRTPYFCSGCPHNSSTRSPDNGALVGGGIGCHGLVLVMDSDRVGTVTGLTHMGGEGAQWLGMAPFVDTRHFIQNLGDGTFAHSGSLAVRAAVAAGVPTTYKILFNSTVAMTGGQDPVGARGGLAQLVATLLAEGVGRVVVTSPDPRRTRRALRRGRVAPRGRVRVRHRDDLVAAQTELAAEPGVTVLVHDQECAAELRRKRKRGELPTPTKRVVINEGVCEGCGDCGQRSNCLSVRPVETELGRKTRIHQFSCNLDYSCVDGDCPSFVTVTPGTTGRTVRTPEVGALPEPVPSVPVDDFTVRIAGIGGTGIVTIAQVLATAAALDGRHVRALDQTGVSQKGGAVVSDVKVSVEPKARAAKLARGECDLYLVCDSLVGTEPQYLESADPERTIAVLSSAEAPTGHMVVDPAVAAPDRRGIRSAIEDRVRLAHHLAADELANELFGDEQFTNMLLVGAAYQAGALPISAKCIEEAIELNGARVPANLMAFRHGRRVVAEGLEPAEPEPTPTDVGALIAHRVTELTSYQDGRYADEFARFVAGVRGREAEVVPGSTSLTEAVARNLFKLMAYKDEYEVARLHLDPEFDRQLRAEWGEGAKIGYRLHPPFLRALGMKRKIALGRWFRLVFHVLAPMRRLRGTAADPFGHTRVRRAERALVAEYRATVESALRVLDHENLESVVDLARLPDMVRGYEEIKLANVERYRAEVARRLPELTGDRATPTGPGVTAR
ncbi:MAG: indolepyruvate ferredoxin oxidoreductase family protein [Actinophytocola sp.]|uniref:indolepyruvate ferredoxin oxidoreductase family protein n=1 Tax=Actinophytocola sp. TaxID=1872138 RepID=UPI003D6C6783